MNITIVGGGTAGWSLWSFILGGTGNLSSTTAVKDLERFKLYKLAEFELANFVHNTENSIIDLPDNTYAIKARQRMF
jgi:hypothetical protein